MCVEADGAAGTTPVNQPILSLEERVMVALAARGHQRIAPFIANAVLDAYPPAPGLGLFAMSDEDFVRALEAEVFGK